MITNIEITEINHETAKLFVEEQRSSEISSQDAIVRIVSLNKGLYEFWSTSDGWSAIEEAELLKKSRLDWQVLLSETLSIWITESEKQTDGMLILAWTNLGILLEGSMKLFLSVYYTLYRDDAEAIKRKGEFLEPDGLQLESLRQFFLKRVWDEEMDNWIRHIQQRRNGVHAFKHREIGSFDEFERDILNYLDVLRYINFRLPYPD